MSDNVKRSRSPNYPGLGLLEASNQLRHLYDRINRHAAPKEAVVKGLGYGGLNGASATALSAHVKYGLLDRSEADDYKISDLGMRILFHESKQEYATALNEAARLPPLFSELIADFAGEVPHEDVLRPRLIRRGFLPIAVPIVMNAFRETMEFVTSNSEGYTPAANKATEGSVEALEASRVTVPAVGAGFFRPAVAPATNSREEVILDDDGNSIIMKFPTEPTVETYEFLKDYLEFRVQRMRKAIKKMEDN